MVSANPAASCRARMEPTYLCSASSVTAAENCAESAMTAAYLRRSAPLPLQRGHDGHRAEPGRVGQHGGQRDQPKCTAGTHLVGVVPACSRSCRITPTTWSGTNRRKPLPL